VIFGKQSAFDATLDVEKLNGTNGVQFIGAFDGDLTGGNVENAGDVNGDGFDDVIIGANGDNVGAVYIVFGLANGTATGPLTVAANGKSATYVDWDGDLVTVKTTKGTLDASQFVFSNRNTSTGGYQLYSADFTAATTGGEFTGTNLTFTAKRGPTGGNSFVNVGFLNASGVDLGLVTIGGDLGRLAAGTANGDAKV
jgi:hypothetical protein